jgi:hypothetical protein
MPSAPPVGTEVPLSYRVFDIVNDAFIETGAWAPGEEANRNQEEAQWGFRKFNYLTDIWQAKQFYVFSYAFNAYTMKANLNPQTIGPSGTATFSTNGQPRPVRIESATLLLQSSAGPSSANPGLVDLKINMRDRQWWADQSVKQIQTNVPTDLYYDPTSPDGSLYFWPVTNCTRQVRLQTWQTVSQFVSIQDPIGGPGGPGTLPPAYRAALMQTLAEMLQAGLNKAPSASLASAALQARAAVFGNNVKSPRISTQDCGMPQAKASGQKQDFNWAYGNYPGGRPQ